MRLFHTIILSIMLFCNYQLGLAQKINGLSYVAKQHPINQSHTISVVHSNANFISLMPFAFLPDKQKPELYFNSDKQWFGETAEGLEQYAKTLRKTGVKLMIKPQIWVRHGIFTGTVEMPNTKSWEQLEKNYSRFILEYAQIAQKLGAEIYCLGTELQQFVTHRPTYWSQLIAAVRKVYTGKLTYAANWNEYEYTPFWKELDYIGVDAYFPISNSKTPTIKEGINGLQLYKKSLQKWSSISKKPILFTEFGYRSVDYAGKRPWDSQRIKDKVNIEAQANCLTALFESFWSEKWFAGGFIWKWFPNHKKVGGIKNNRFTPQNKPAEKLLRQFYEQ
ncbi:MAG: glycoside hydrolase [Flavobacteriaceae bacterium]|nr:glycoside hydrolase [Flavobacteriaceae bacterium]